MHMARFRCPRCGAVVEGLHDRCPRCNVLFKYRKEDIDLLEPYKAPAVEQPEVIEEKPAPEPLPEPVKEEPAPVVQEPAPAPEPIIIDNSAQYKAKYSASLFGILGFVFILVNGWNIIGIIFGAIALGRAKKAKPIKAKAGKVFGILDLILGVLGLLLAIALITLLVLAGLGVAGYFIYLNWDAIMAAFNGSSALALF